MLLDTPKRNSFQPKRVIMSKTLSPSSYSLPSPYSLSPTGHTFPLSMMEENIDNAETIITKWDPSSSLYTKFTSLFQHNRKEAKEFIKSVKELRRAMHYLVAESSASSKLVHAQLLMQTAMKRLEKEFYQILSENRDHLDPESISSQSSVGSSSFGEEDDDVRSEDELGIVSEAITEVERVSANVMSDLKSIADCMIVCGYGKECVEIYKIVRKSIIDEGLYRLQIERFKSSRILKLNWEALVGTIKNWLTAIRIAVKTLYNGERILCDHVFSAPSPIRESCFCEITKGAINLFRFPELIAKTHKKSPERIFQLMELYEAFSELRPEIESIFSSESTSAIRSQAVSSSLKLRDSIHSILTEFESTIQKHSSKTPVLGGGIHPITRSVTDYVCSLADHRGVLSGILAAYPTPGNSPLKESLVETPTNAGDNSEPDAASVHLAWLILVLLCKLDSKAKLYKGVALSYLFLANNLQFIVEKVKATSLRFLLGEDWISKHANKVRQYALSYEATAWTKVFSSLPDTSTSSPSPPETVKESLRRFCAAFEEAYRKQTSWIVPDGKLRGELKVSIAEKLVPKYRQFYDANLAVPREERNLEVLVRFSPDDLRNYLSDLFYGASTSGSSKSSLLSSSSSSLAPHRCLSQ